MIDVVFSNRARKALGDIVVYTRKKWGVKQSISYVSALKKQTEILAHMPNMGKIYHQYKYQEIRVFPFKQHLIYYFTTSTGITVFHVTHKSMEQSEQVN